MVKKGQSTKVTTPSKRSQASKYQNIVTSATDKYTTGRRQTRSQTKTALKKTKILTRGKKDELSRSKSNLTALVEAQVKKGGKKKDE